MLRHLEPGTYKLCTIILAIFADFQHPSSDVIANRSGISGQLFGATVLAMITSLPEIATGVASVGLEDYEMAVSDIFGGNGFLPVLFLVASLLSGQSILPNATHQELYLSCLGILLTVVYLTGLLFRSNHQVWKMGIDSAFVLLLYVLGMIGLTFIEVIH